MRHSRNNLFIIYILMFKKVLLLSFIFLVLIAFIVWNQDRNPEKDTNYNQADRVEIVTTLFPWYDLARQIGGDKVAVSLLLSPGLDPHSFEPRPQDMLNIKEADLFVYTSEEMEPWSLDLLSQKEENKILEISAGLNTIERPDIDEHKEDSHDEVDEHHEDEHGHEGLDPHVWLDPLLMKEMALRLTEKLIAIDGNNEDYYRQRLSDYQESLNELDQAFQTTLANCASNTLVYAGHNAFSYLVQRYNLSYLAAQGFSPNAESTPTQLAQMSNSLKEQGLRYLYVDKMENQQLAAAVAQEAGVGILSLKTAGNIAREDLEANLSYQDIMRQNLEQLRIGLQCQKY